MKKVIYLFLMVVLSVSCFDDFLTEEPETLVTNNNFLAKRERRGKCRVRDASLVSLGDRPGGRTLPGSRVTF